MKPASLPVQMKSPSHNKPWQPQSGNGEQFTGQNRQIILIGLMVPMMMVVLNFSVFSVALPQIRETFQIQADVVGWVVTIYTLPFMIAMPLYGRLGDELGKRRLFLIGIVTFLIGTIIAFSATDLRLFMLGRAIQGLGAAGGVPLSMAIISQIFPVGERGKAMGTWNSVGPLTGIAAPFMSGLLIDYIGWRTIFGPVILAALAAFWVIREQIPYRRVRPQSGILRTFDWGGVVMLSGAVTMLTFYLSSPSITGVAALRDWRLLASTLLLFGLLIYWERRQANPYVALNIFANKTFSRASFSVGIRMFTMSGIGFLMPLYLTDVHGFSASSTGVVLMIHAGAMLLTMRIGGQLADRWTSRWPVSIGMAVQVSTMMGFASLPDTATTGVVTTIIIIHGLGAGLSLAALHRASMGQIPQEEAGLAAGLYSMVRFTGTMLGPTVGGVVLQQGLDRSLLPIHAYQTVFWFIAGVAVLGVVSGLGLRE